MSMVVNTSNDTEVQVRKRYLIHQLKKLGLEKTADGRSLYDLTLYSLEWVHIEEKNKMARAMGERS